MSTNNKSGHPHRPPGLEHVDTAANLKALSKLGFNGNRSATEITFTIIPPTPSIDRSFDDKLNYGKLQHVDALLAPPNHTKGNAGACRESVFVTLPDQHEPRYFLPSGLLDDNEAEEMALLHSLDLKASTSSRRSCDAPCCLRARAYQLTDYLSQKGGDHYGPMVLFLPVSSPSTSWPSSSSDCGSEDSSLFPPSISSLEGCTFRSHTFGSTTFETPSSSFGAKPYSTGHCHGDVPESDPIYFHRTPSEGALLSDIKALKPGCLLGPEEDVMASWGIPGSPTWIRIKINQHGYTKASVYVPTRCYCANTTRAGLALDIAFLLDSYFTKMSVRPGFENCPRRRQNIEDLYLHSLRRNMDDPLMVWRISISYSAVSWAK